MRSVRGPGIQGVPTCAGCCGRQGCFWGWTFSQPCLHPLGPGHPPQLSLATPPCRPDPCRPDSQDPVLDGQEDEVGEAGARAGLPSPPEALFSSKY